MKNMKIILSDIFAFFRNFFTSCKAERYKVICAEGAFKNVKSAYRPGERVKIYFPYVATDTDYSFCLDGERINGISYSDRKGFVLTFTMPGHDVELTCNSINSMENPFCE